MSSAKPTREAGKESIGWIYLATVILIFPALFFLCVFFPMWIGLTPVFP
jgi:hypothetical protein